MSAVTAVTSDKEKKPNINTEKSFSFGDVEHKLKRTLLNTTFSEGYFLDQTVGFDLSRDEAKELFTDLKKTGDIIEAGEYWTWIK